MGASMSERLSPMPPEECLSTTGPGRSQCSTVPESRMASVRPTASSRLMPRKNTAMAKAATWPSDTLPEVRPAMKSFTSSRSARRRRASGG